MPISGGVGGGGSGYFALSNTNRIVGSNAGSGNASNDVFFGGLNAGAANAGTRNIGIGTEACRQAFTTDLIVIGYNNPRSMGIDGSNAGGVLIGSGILATFGPATATRDVIDNVLIGQKILGVINPNGGVLSNVVIGGAETLKGLEDQGATPTTNVLNASVVVGMRTGAAIDRRGGISDTVLIGYSVGDTPAVSDPDGFNIALQYYSSVGVGAGALQAHAGTNLVAVGAFALGGAGFRVGSGSGARPGNSSDNVAVGSSSGEVLCAGTGNVFLGSVGAQGLTSGSDNILIGVSTALPSVGLGQNSRNILIGSRAGIVAPAAATTSTDNIFIGTLAGKEFAATVNNKFTLEHFDSALNAFARPFLYGELDQGNLMLGRAEDASGPLLRGFNGGTNTFILQPGTAPGALAGKVGLYVTETAGVFSLRCIGPSGVATVIATGL